MAAKPRPEALPALPSGPTRMAKLFHALSDETRLLILERLRGGEQCVCELTCCLGAEQSRLSFHLRTLREAGLVTHRREGRMIHYSLNPAVFAEAVHAIAGFLAAQPRPVPYVPQAQVDRRAP